MGKFDPSKIPKEINFELITKRQVLLAEVELTKKSRKEKLTFYKIRKYFLEDLSLNINDNYI